MRYWKCSGTVGCLSQCVISSEENRDPHQCVFSKNWVDGINYSEVSPKEVNKCIEDSKYLTEYVCDRCGIGRCVIRVPGKPRGIEITCPDWGETVKANDYTWYCLR